MFEINVIEAISLYVSKRDTEMEEDLQELDLKAMEELCHAREALEQEMDISRCVKASTLEEVNLGMIDDLWPVSIAKGLELADKVEMITLLKYYGDIFAWSHEDIFAWSHEDIKGLDPKFYQHHIDQSKDTKPVQQRHYRMNPNYVVKVKKEINKLFKFYFIRPVK